MFKAKAYKVPKKQLHRLVPSTRLRTMSRPISAQSPSNVEGNLPEDDAGKLEQEIVNSQAIQADNGDDELFPEGGRGWLVVLGCFMLAS